MSKAQVKFGETFGIILIVYLVLMVGLNFYNNSNNKDLQELVDNDNQARAFEKYYYIINLNLLHVSERGIVDNEFDLQSLRSFKSFSESDESREYLRRQLGEAEINVQVYDSHSLLGSEGQLEAMEDLVLYSNFPDNDVANFQIFRSTIPIYDPIEKTNLLGVIQVKVPTS